MACPGWSGSNNTSSLLLDGVGTADTALTTLFNSCNCTTWERDTRDAVAISIIRIITSTISVFGSASIILLVLLTGKLNTAEVHPLFILSVADFILAILWLIGGVVWLSPDANGWARPESNSHTGMCYVLGTATSMAQIVTFLLTVVYAQSALLRLREYYINKGKLLLDQDKKKRLRYIITGVSYVLSWVLPIIVVLSATEVTVGIEKTNSGCWCIIDFFNLRPDDGDVLGSSPFNKFAIVQASLIGPFFVLTSIIIIAYYVMAVWYIRKVYALQAQQQNQQHGRHKAEKLRSIIKTVMVRLSLFVLIFIICGAPSLAGAIDVWTEENRLHLSEEPDRVILFIHAILAPMQGFLNAVVYGWSRKEFRQAIRLSNRGEKSSSNYQSLNNSSVPDINVTPTT